MKVFKIDNNYQEKDRYLEDIREKAAEIRIILEGGPRAPEGQRISREREC